VNLSPYEGVVQVLLSNSQTPENSIKVGDVYISQEMNRDELLNSIKEMAARNGADMIILYNDEPLDIGDGWHTWSARAYKTTDGD